jgi:hypothetical protein
MLAYIPAPWILWVMDYNHSQYTKGSRRTPEKVTAQLLCRYKRPH